MKKFRESTIDVNVRCEGNICLIDVTGCLNALTTSQLEKEIQMSLYRRTLHFYVFNITRLESLDSVGMGCLVKIYNRIEDPGTHMIMYGLSDELLKLFRWTNMDKSIQIFNTEDEALDYIAEKSF